MDILVGICPSCGTSFEMEEEGKRESRKEGEPKECKVLCGNPAAMPTGERLRADQATKIYTDGDMHEMTRSEYINAHGIDPEPIMESVNKWRENQVRLWARQYGSESEVDEWIRRLSRRTQV